MVSAQILSAPASPPCIRSAEADAVSGGPNLAQWKRSTPLSRHAGFTLAGRASLEDAYLSVDGEPCTSAGHPIPGLQSSLGFSLAHVFASLCVSVTPLNS